MISASFYNGWVCLQQYRSPPTLHHGEISEKGPHTVRFFRTMSGQWFFRSTFFGLFLRKRWTKGGPSNVVGP